MRTARRLASALVIVPLGISLAPINCRAANIQPVAFLQIGTSLPVDFTAMRPIQAFDVANTGDSHLVLMFEPAPSVEFVPGILRLAPHTRRTVRMSVGSSVKSFLMRYAVSSSAVPFQSHADRYRAYNDGETEMCVPVPPALFRAMHARAESILNDSKVLLTDKDMPAGTSIYTAGPFYKAAGLFARDFLFTLEGAGRDLVTAEEVRSAVDFLALKQLPENRKVGRFLYPKGAIPDHAYPDGRFCWGPGLFYGNDTAHFNRPSMDEAMAFTILAWHYGYKAEWDTRWQTWYKANSKHFIDAWYSVPRNARTGLVTQWTTPERVPIAGIPHDPAPVRMPLRGTTGTVPGCALARHSVASVMWGFHDSYAFGGDDLGTSVLACNAARALADMFDHVSDSASSKAWNATADAMRDAIRAQFNPAGYLPWGVGESAPTMAAPDITGYAVWSGILSDHQADAASDWFAARYHADKKAGGAADLFNLTRGLRGSVRMARKADDVTPGRHVWPNLTPPHWENLTYGYNSYQDGGYWYYMSLGIAATLWRKHPIDAEEWVANAYFDITTGDGTSPYERIDATKPVNQRYNASAGPLLGMGMPGVVSSVKVTVGTTSWNPKAKN